jgi:hypothetical protein
VVCMEYVFRCSLSVARRGIVRLLGADYENHTTNYR